MTGFVNSEEFANLCAAYGIDQGSGDWSADDIPAVSYTHLDVYKRQVCFSTG